MNPYFLWSVLTWLDGLILLMVCISCDAQSVDQIEIRGIYGHPAPLWERGHNLNDLGVNAVFVHSGSIDQKLIARARKESFKVFAEFATLNGKGYVEHHPEAHPVDQFGQKVEAATWFMGVCPTNGEFRAYRFQQLRDLLSTFDLDGVWMDYVHWHAQFESPEPVLPETCFCEHCLSIFSEAKGLNIGGNSQKEKAKWILENVDTAWRNWRCEVIADWTRKIREIIEQEKPGALLGLYHCPWKDDEFEHARERILGLDYDLLIDLVDVFSPMVYHARMGRKPEWVAENILWHSNRLDSRGHSQIKIWPIVQAHDDPYTISAEEFEKVLKGGTLGSANGIMMFTTRALAESPDKIEVMRQFYQDLAN